MPEQIKAHTRQYTDPHARYHDGDWLAVQTEAAENDLGAIIATCLCGNTVYIHPSNVYRRRAYITCPRCGRTSHNANDVREGYCSRCHDWTTPRE